MHSPPLEEIASRLALHVGIRAWVISECDFRITHHYCAVRRKIGEQPAAFSRLNIELVDSKREHVRLSRPDGIVIRTEADYQICRRQTGNYLRAPVTYQNPAVSIADSGDDRSTISRCYHASHTFWCERPELSTGY